MLQPPLRLLSVVTFLLVASLPSHFLSAQEDSIPANDPELRLPGKDVVTVPGGMPSIGVRARLVEEIKARQTHSIGSDILLASIYLNLSYDLRVSHFFVVGGRVILPFGYHENNSDEQSITGASLEARYHFLGTAPTGLFLRLSPMYYTGTYEAEDRGGDQEIVDLSLTTLAVDAGLRVMLTDNLALDGMAGIEVYLGGADSLENDVPLVAFRLEEEESFLPHIAMRLGYSW